MEGTVNKAAGLVFLLCRCGDRDFHVYLWWMREIAEAIEMVLPPYFLLLHFCYRDITEGHTKLIYWTL